MLLPEIELIFESRRNKKSFELRAENNSKARIQIKLIPHSEMWFFENKIKPENVTRNVILIRECLRD